MRLVGNTDGSTVGNTVVSTVGNMKLRLRARKAEKIANVLSEDRFPPAAPTVLKKK